MKGLSIGQVARRAGLRASAIRYYEASGLLPAPIRVNGWRRYGDGVFTALAAIELAQHAGFSLAEMRTLLRGFAAPAPPTARWTALARRKLSEIDALIARGHAMKRLLTRGIECRCVEIASCPIVAERVKEMRNGRKADRVRHELPRRSATSR